jgi:hypothetical protein
MYIRRRPWVFLLAVAMLPAIAQASVKGKPIKKYNRRSLQEPNIPSNIFQGKAQASVKGKPIKKYNRRSLQEPNIPSNIFQGKGKGSSKKSSKGSSKAEKPCVEEPTPTSSPAPTKVKKTKNPTHSPAPSITASPTKSEKKSKSPVAPTVSPRPTYTQKPTKYPKYCSEEATLSPAPAAPIEPTLSQAPIVAPSPPTSRTTIEPTLAPTTSPNCNAIAAGTASTDFDAVNFSVDFLIVVTGNVPETLVRMEQFLQQNVATVLAGCTDTTRRRLQEAADIVNVKFDVKEDLVASGKLTQYSFASFLHCIP